MTINLALFKQKQNKEGHYPIVIVLRDGAKRSILYTGVYSELKDWDEKAKNIRNKHPGGMAMKMTLEKKVLDLKIRMLQGATFRELANEKSGETFNAFGRSQIKILLDQKKYGNAKVYSTALDAFERMLGDVPFSELSFAMLKEFRDLKLAAGVTPTSVNSYMRALRAIWNRNDADLHYPFKRGLMATEINRMPRNHSLDDLRDIFSYHAPKGSNRIKRALDYWKLGFLFRGMDLVDLLSLEKNCIQKEYIVYARRKTGQQLKVKVHRAAKEILEAYFEGEMLLPELNGPIKLEPDYKKYKDKRSGLLRSLAAASVHMQLQQKLTSKTCRFSFASLAKELGIEKGVIGEMLGHADQSVTAIYLDALPQNQIDAAHELVINQVFKT